ncbi:hypothetical protein Tco_0281958 [Tanacetum coccineum]
MCASTALLECSHSLPCYFKVGEILLLQPSYNGEHTIRSYQGAWYLDDGTIIGDTLIVGEVLKVIMKDGPGRGLHLNIDKTEVFWPKEDLRSRFTGVFPPNISRPLHGVKLLGGSASEDFDFSSELVMKKVTKSIELMDVVAKINDPQYYFRMDDPSMTMEEYIMFEEEKARKRGKVFNWQTATYGKIRIDDDLHDLSSLEAEFPAIVINDAFAPHDTFQYISQVNMALPPREQRHRFLRYEGLEYPDTNIVDFEGRFSTWLMCMTQLMDASGLTYQAFDGSFRGSSPATFQRRTRQRTGKASTSTAQQDPLQPDP